MRVLAELLGFPSSVIHRRVYNHRTTKLPLLLCCICASLCCLTCHRWAKQCLYAHAFRCVAATSWRHWRSQYEARGEIASSCCSACGEILNHSCVAFRQLLSFCLSVLLNILQKFWVTKYVPCPPFCYWSCSAVIWEKLLQYLDSIFSPVPHLGLPTLAIHVTHFITFNQPSNGLYYAQYKANIYLISSLISVH